MALLAVDSAPCKARPRRGASHVLSDLHIQSLQDTSTYDARQQSAGAGVSLCIPPICYGASSVSVNASKAKVNGDFASVAEQSGIFAGDGGYQIRVQGHTELTGGAVASSPAATDAEANRFDTAAIVTSDLENRDVYEAGGFSLGVSLSGKLGDQDSAAARQEMSKADRKAANDAKTGVGMTPGLSHTSGSQASTTRSGISGGALTITDAAAQHALTGQSAEQAVAALNRDVVTGQDTSGALGRAWNGHALGEDVQTGLQITSTALPQVAGAVGTQMGKTAAALREQAAVESDPARQQELLDEAGRYDEGGLYRNLAHAALGALGGGTAGALGAGASSAATPALAEAVNAMGLPEPVRQALIIAGGAAVGAAAGGTTGAASGGNQTANNYLRHDEAARRARLQEQQLACHGDAACSSGLQAEIDQLDRLDHWRDEQIAQACQSPGSALCGAWVANLDDAALSYRGHSVYGDPLVQAERSGVLADRFRYGQLNGVSPLVAGVGNGLFKLTPPAMAVGAVAGAYELAVAIVENGAIDTAIGLAQGIAGMPADLRARLHSDDPRVRGEALVDFIGLASGASALCATLAHPRTRAPAHRADR